ncbi:MAG: DUF6559 family protein [Cellvibrionaceae bacterium]
MKWLERYRRKNAIKFYARTLPFYLDKEFGIRDAYTLDEMNNLFETYQLSDKYKEYAMAIYTNKISFKEYCKKKNTTFNYVSLRNEVSNICFREEYQSFTTLDLFESIEEDRAQMYELAADQALVTHDDTGNYSDSTFIDRKYSDESDDSSSSSDGDD